MCGTPGNGTVSYPHTFTADPATSQNHYTLPNDKTATATVKFTKPSGGGTGGGGGGSSIPTATVDKTVTNGSAGVKAENGEADLPGVVSRKKQLIPPLREQILSGNLHS